MNTNKLPHEKIFVGAASKIINNMLGTHIQGGSVDNRAKYIRDDLEANALFLRKGSESVLLVSCDVAGLLPEFVIPARDAIGMDTDYMDRLQTWLVELAKESVDAARPGRIGWGLGNVFTLN